MVQVLRPDGAVAGAGFLVSDRVVVTCAHVVEAAGGRPGAEVQVTFPHVRGAGQVEGQAPGELWRATQDEDVAFIRLRSMPAGARMLPLGSAEGCRGHQVRSFGFPAQAPPEGHFGFGVAGDLLPGSGRRSARLQLTAANDLTTGFSGGPVLDEVTGLVIGILTEIAAPDELGKGQGVAYVTPTQVLRGILPELVERDVCPYRGLEPFTAEHARWFQGRQEAVRQVVTNLAQQRRLTLLLGPSGSGKSSLIQAGVLRELTEGELPGSDRWLVLIARPRQDLAAEIERAGLPGAITEGIAGAVTRRLAADPDYQRILLIIDQFEELFVQTADGHRRNQQSVADQIAAAVGSHAALSVILVMRDDFYPQLAALAPGLLKAATSGLLNVPGTLSQRDLNDIVTLPARDVGLRFQPGLPERIVSDVLATNPEEAPTQQAPVTVLPLLELTLSQLWVRRQNGHLTHESYRRIGAVSGSLTTWCDSALNELPPDQQLTARRILTSLVRPADRRRRVPAVRAQVPLDELRELAAAPDGAPDGDVDTVLAALARHRIITTQTLRDPQYPDAPPGEPVAELIHDALIRDWGTLNDWVRQDHRFHDWLDLTRERHASYAEKGDPGDLLGGTALAEGLEWARQRRLPGEISAFIMASKQRQQAAIRRTRRLNRTLATLVVIMLLALLAGGGAVWQWRTVTAQRQAAQSRQFAIQSDTLIDADPELASLLAIEAYRTSSTPESLASLQTAAGPSRRRPLTGHSGAVNSVMFSPNGQTFATASSDRTVRLWNVDPVKSRVVLPKQAGAVLSVAFSPDGRTLATASDRTVQLWDSDTAKIRATLVGRTGAVQSVAFSPDGRTLATGSVDHTVRLWDSETAKIRATLVGHTGAVQSVAFSPDGRTLATGSVDRTVRLWDSETAKIRATLVGHTGAVQSVAFSPDGRTLATGSVDRTVRLWDVATGLRTRSALTGHTDAVQSVAFSPDGKSLATASTDKTARLWDVTTRMSRATLVGHTATVWSVAFSPDGRTLATASADRTVQLWGVVVLSPSGAIQQICRTVKRDFTPEERQAYHPSRGPVCPTSGRG
ncbi:nSTAND1 domain-containing NTPase [Streptomyces echinatus]